MSARHEERWGEAGMRPDEVLMAKEEGGQASAGEVSLRELLALRVECVCGLLQVLTAGAAEVQEIRDRVLVLAAEACPELVSGLGRLWHGVKEKQRLEAVQGRVLAMGLTWEPVAGTELLRFLLRDGTEARAVGRRVLCILYAFTPDESLRGPLARSLETMGRALDYGGDNVRSGPQAAIVSVAKQYVDSIRRQERGESHFKFWFQKNEGCREALRESARGNRNRSGGARVGSG